MAINPDLLISAAMLQDGFIDKLGIPMAAGTITCYQDNSRTTLKNWYYQTGTPGNYTYIALPNPLTLSAAGTICDVNGVDTIPFYYPYSELDEAVFQPYYITIVNYAQTNQITRANFPFIIPEPIIPVVPENTFNNLIVNGGFWRNIMPNTLTTSPFQSYTLNTNSVPIVGNIATVMAPSQHVGLRYPDIQFLKNNTSATDYATFSPFPFNGNQPISTPFSIVPEYYVNHDCASAGIGETQKCYQFPICLHINTLAGLPYTVTIQAQNIGGTGIGQDVINLYIFQDSGTGTTPQAPFFLGSITLNTAWQTYIFTSIIPPAIGVTLGAGGDDGLYLQVEMPLNLTCSINFTNPSLYLTTDIIPNNQFVTYDEIEPIINGPRTGDIRTSINQFYNYGWVPMNDGTIGDVKSNASSYANQDAWPLFNLLWTLFSPYNYMTGMSNPLAQMYNSSGSPISYSGSALVDWSANNAIALTKMLGRVMLGTVPYNTAITPIPLPITFYATFTGSGTTITASRNLTGFFNGMPVVFTGVSTLQLYLVYYVSGFNGTTTLSVSDTFSHAIAGTNLQTVDATGTIIGAVPGSTEGEYAHTMIANELVSHVHPPLSPNTSYIGINSGGPYPTALNANSFGTVATTGANTTTGSAFNVTQPSTWMNVYIKL